MTLERDELALKAALDRRRPATLPRELLERLERIPAEIEPLRPLPVRLALGIAPWAAVAAIVLLAGVAPSLLPNPSTPGAPSSTGWTAADPGGGLAEIGIFGVPWIPLTITLAAVGAVCSAWSAARGEGAFGWLRLRRGGGRPSRVSGIAAVAGVLAGVLFVNALSWAVRADGGPMTDALEGGGLAAPGPEVTEIRPDGLTFGGEQPWEEVAVPHYIYRLRPGEPFSFVASVRNATSVPIRVLGLQSADVSSRDLNWTGLGLLRDTAVLSSAPESVVPFEPFELAPGEERAIVVAGIAGRCADPAGTIPPSKVEDGNGGASYEIGPVLDVVYEAWGWRLSAWAYPSMQATIPTRSDCE